MNLDIINSFLFHPRKSDQDLSKKDILIEVEYGVQIGIRFHLISKSAPTILFFHGNGEIVTDYDEIANVFNIKKINFIIADFRGYGFSNGIPNRDNTLLDSHLILDYVRGHLVEREYDGYLTLMGRSLGSVSVIELSKRYPDDFNGLIIESGFADEGPLYNLIGTTAEQAGLTKQDGFLNGEKIKQYVGPLLVIHAEKDHIIPYSQGELLYKSCPSIKKKLILISNANHNNILEVGYLKYFEAIERFINL